MRATILGFCCALLVAVLFFCSAPGKNFIGGILGYGGCPNCGDS